MRRTPKALIAATLEEFEAAIELTSRAQVWQQNLRYLSQARFTKGHYSQINELAFLQSFLTWEAFLEEAFILYLLGKKAPTGFHPQRHAIPLNRQHAEDLLASDARHTDWTAADRVIARATRFFNAGRPFVGAIRPRVNMLNNLKTIRNAISHRSAESFEKFETLVRNELTYYPNGMTPGTFLMMLVPGATPPKTYLQSYVETLQTMAETIVPI